MPNVCGACGDQTYGPATNRTEQQANTSPRLHMIVGFVDCLLVLVRLQTARKNTVELSFMDHPLSNKVFVIGKTKMPSKGS